MKYRIKDDTERKLINALFGITEFTSESQDNSLTIRASFAGDGFGVWFFKTEPVQELAESWNSYPETKPEKKGSYFCAIHLNQQNTVVVATYDKYSGFRGWDSDIFAWQELPKIWKEAE